MQTPLCIYIYRYVCRYSYIYMFINVCHIYIYIYIYMEVYSSLHNRGPQVQGHKESCGIDGRAKAFLNHLYSLGHRLMHPEPFLDCLASTKQVLDIKNIRFTVSLNLLRFDSVCVCCKRLLDVVSSPVSEFEREVYPRHVR